MFIPERYRRNPWQRPSPVAPEPTPNDVNPSDVAESARCETDDGDIWDDPGEEQLENEEAELSDADFYKSLRQDISAVQEGSLQTIADTEHRVRQMRPWSKKRHPRDRYGNRLY